jgi:hypothetical protein
VRVSEGSFMGMPFSVSVIFRIMLLGCCVVMNLSVLFLTVSVHRSTGMRWRWSEKSLWCWLHAGASVRPGRGECRH